jgi:glucosamine-6-phosphate deaminase
MRVLVTPDYRTLSHTAAELVLKAIHAKPNLTLGLPTGNTPLGMYEELVTRYQEDQLDFSQLQTFNLDEYCGLPHDHPKSFRTYMRKVFFDRVNVAPANIHFPEEHHPQEFERGIQGAGGIDLLIVGIGANGHIAFNEPGSLMDSRTRIVDLAPETIQNARQHFGSEAVPSKAVTMGVGTILDARRIVLLASGASKADAVECALRGPVSESCPASALQRHGRVVVMLDEAASSK